MYCDVVPITLEGCWNPWLSENLLVPPYYVFIDGYWNPWLCENLLVPPYYF